MGNPFYIPRENSALDIMKLGLQLYGMKNQMDLGREENALKSRQLDLSSEQHAATQAQNAAELTTKNRQVDVMEQGNRIQENKLNPREKSFGTGDLIVMKNRWRMAGFDPDKMTEYFSLLEPVAKDPSVNRGAYAEQITAGWDQGVKETLTTSMAESIDAILKKDPNADVTKQVEILNTIEATPQEKAMEVLFPDIVQYDQAEAAKTKQATAPSSDQVIADIAMKVAKGELTEKQGEVMIHMIKGIKVNPKDNLMSVPGVGLVDVSGEKPSLVPGMEAKDKNQRPTVVPPGSVVLGKDGKPIYTAPNRPEKPAEAEKGPSATELRMTAKDVADAEAKILSNKNSDVAKGEVDVFNQYAEKPYAYRWGKVPGQYAGKNDGWEKVSLPKNTKGKQITAKDIYEFATRTGRTYEDVLEEVLQAAGEKKK